MATENTARLAVLIDADNAQPSITEGLLAEVAKYGTAHVKRAYGDWTGPSPEILAAYCERIAGPGRQAPLPPQS
jgi:hypothetical protein